MQALRKVTPRLLQQVAVSTLPFKTRIPILVIHWFGDMEVLGSSAFTDAKCGCMLPNYQPQKPIIIVIIIVVIIVSRSISSAMRDTGTSVM